MPLFLVPQNAGFPTSLSLHHTIHHLENIPTFNWHLFNLAAKNLFLGRKKYWKGICPPPQPPSYAYDDTCA
jgi:hypothetical protein